MVEVWVYSKKRGTNASAGRRVRDKQVLGDLCLMVIDGDTKCDVKCGNVDGVELTG